MVSILILTLIWTSYSLVCERIDLLTLIFVPNYVFLLVFFSSVLTGFEGSQGYPNVQYSLWKHIACNKLQLTEEVAWMYFEHYHLVAGELSSADRIEMFHLNSQSERSTVRQKMTANTLQFVLFLYIQQLHKISMKSSLVTGDEWPSRTRSPDLETARSQTSSKNLDENTHFTFVLHHLNDLMELMIDPSTGPGNLSEVDVTVEAVKALGFLIAASIDGNK